MKKSFLYNIPRYKENCFFLNTYFPFYHNKTVFISLKAWYPLKCGTHLWFNAIKIIKKIYLALLTQVET